MVKEMMDNMWKGVGDINNQDWAKKMNFMSSIDPVKISSQLIGLQKEAFNDTYKNLLQMQQKAEEIAKPIFKNNPIPEEWQTMYKKNQDDAKKSIDEGFAKAESYFLAVAESKKYAKPAEK